MTDFVTIPATGTTGTATPDIATDNVGGIHFQYVKLDLGTTGVSSKVSGTVPVSGSVALSSGTVTLTSGALTLGAVNQGSAGSANWPVVSASSGIITVSPVSGVVFQIQASTSATQPVSGVVALSSGTVVVSGTVATLASSSGGNQPITASSGTLTANVVQATAGNLNVIARKPPGAWNKTHSPVAATVAVANTSAKGASIRNVCNRLSYSLSSTAAPGQTVTTFTLWDGTSSGTALWTQRLSMPATAGGCVPVNISDLWIEGTANTQMTFGTVAAPGTNSFATIAFGGCEITT